MRLTAALVVPVLVASLGVPTAAVAAPVPDPLAKATSESTLRWKDCGGESLRRVECAVLTVPRDWGNPDSGTYRIAVGRIPAAVTPSRGVLFFNPGGPGSAGLTALDFVSRRLPDGVRDSFDLVTFDPRGVGQSQPKLKNCATTDLQLPPTGRVDWEAVTAEYLDAVGADLQQCFALNQNDAEFVGSWQVIRDIDALRRALGVEKINFWGMSYGTNLGRAYAQQFPQRVRALVLDGAITPTPTIGDYAREHIWDDITAIQTMLGAFGPKAKRAYRTVMSYLENQTLADEDGEGLTRWDFVGYLSGNAAYQSSWGKTKKELIEIYDAVRKKRGLNRLLANRIRADVISTRAEESSPVFNFVNCSDMHDRPSSQVLAGAAEQAAKVGGTPLGLFPLDEGTQCAGLPPLGNALPPLAGVLRLSTPPVIVNSIGDNRTPWLGARETANAFTGSSMVTYAGTQHVTYGGPSACVDAAVTPYLLNLIRPPRSVACPLVYP